MLPKTTRIKCGYLSFCPFLGSSQEMKRGKKVQATSLSFAPIIWGYLKIRWDQEPGRCPFKEMLHKPICYRTKATVSSLYRGAMFGGPAWGAWMIPCSRCSPSGVADYWSIWLLIRLGAEGALWRTSIHLIRIYRAPTVNTTSYLLLWYKNSGTSDDYNALKTGCCARRTG